MNSAGRGLEDRLRAAIAAERVVVADSLTGALRVRDVAMDTRDGLHAAEQPHPGGTAAAAYVTAAEHVDALQRHLRELLSSGELRRRLARTALTLAPAEPPTETSLRSAELTLVTKPDQRDPWLERSPTPCVERPLRRGQHA
jgi:hypothetical protein